MCAVVGLHLGKEFSRAVVNHIVDQFLQGIAKDAGKDWVADSKPRLPLDAYVGTYTDPWYGDIEITLGDDGALHFRSPRSEPLSGPLEHFQFDTFIARWIDRKLNADAYVSFSLGPTGEVERIRMKAVSPATDFSFDFHDLDLVRQAPQ